MNDNMFLCEIVFLKVIFFSATSGDRDNNNKFSHCSKANISAVLDAIVDKRKDNCFVKSDGAFCGKCLFTFFNCLFTFPSMNCTYLSLPLLFRRQQNCRRW